MKRRKIISNQIANETEIQTNFVNKLKKCLVKYCKICKA